MVGETEDVDLEIGEGVPKGGLDEGLKGRELDDRHADGLRRDERAMQVTEGRRVQAATVEDVVQGLNFLFLQTETAATAVTQHVVRENPVALRPLRLAATSFVR